ncbi:HPS5 [Branchiostoma lanceolatum]|uniref:HPS5 protein n=1 Tax=Branchiostoma lanceolatum TaxID=7740 RepID=A0A8J9ZME0_BRALA|nr:HPS5 [Branchiostoma lanceolatum]
MEPESSPTPAPPLGVTLDPVSSTALTPAMTYDPGGHVLTDLSSMEDLLAPIKTSSRIKYTCLSVSRRFISLGATTGGLYLFHREKLKCLQLLANKEGAITMVTSAPDDNLVAIATSRGLVVVWELNIERRAKPERLRISPEHRGNTVVSLQWDDKSSRLFIGDDTGKVSVANVPSSGKAKGFFKVPTELLLTADSSVVQMDFANERLMVSTLTRCYLCDTLREKFWHVGKKLRDGKFGACFFRTSAGQVPAIYSARPGSRVWEVDFEGNVLNTHQLKKLLAVPPAPVISNRYEPRFPPPGATFPPQSLTFSRILMFNNRLLLTWTQQGLYIIDPARVQLVMWTDKFKDIADVRCYKNDMYLFHSDSRVSRLSLLPVDKCVGKLFSKQMWRLCAQVCCHYQPSVIPMKARRAVPVSMVTELRQHLGTMDDADELLDQLEELLNRIELNVDSTSSNQSSGRSSVSSIGSVSMLQSGIYQVHSRRGSQESVDSLPEFTWAEEEAGQDGIARPKFDLVSDALATSSEEGKEPGLVPYLPSSQEAAASANEVVASMQDNVESVESSVLSEEKRDGVENVETLALVQKEQAATVESESSASDPEKTSMQSCDSGNSDGANVSPRSGAKMAAGETEVAGASDSGTGEEALEEDRQTVANSLTIRFNLLTDSEAAETTETAQISDKYPKFSQEVPVNSMPLVAIETTGTNSHETPELKMTQSEEAKGEGHRSEEVKGQRALLDRFANVDLEGDELVVQREGRPIKGKRKKKKKANSADISYLSLSEGTAVDLPPSDLRSAFQQKMSTLKTGRLSSDSDTPEGGATPELSSSPVVQQQLKVMKDKLSTRLQDSRSKLATKSKSLMKAIQESEQMGRIRQTMRRPDMQADRGEEDDDVFEDDLGGNQDNGVSMVTESGGHQESEERRRGVGPRVDVTVLMQATRETSEKLKDPEVLFAPDQARTVLSAWLQHMETALQNLYRTVREHNAKVRSRSEVKDQMSEVIDDSVFDRTPINGFADVNNMQQGRQEDESESTESRTLEEEGEGVNASVVLQDSGAEYDRVQDDQEKQNKDISEDRMLAEEEERVFENNVDEKDDSLASLHAKTENEAPALVNNLGTHSPDVTSKEEDTPKNDAGHPQDMEDLQEVFIQEGFHILDPFLLKDESHAEISELVTFCFQFGVLRSKSASSKDMAVSSNIIGQDNASHDMCNLPGQSESVLQEEDAPESDRTCDGNDSFSPIGPHSKEGQHLSATSQSASLSHEEEEWDRNAAQFLKSHFHFLDIEAVRKTLQYRRGPRSKVWEGLMECLHALYSEGAVPDLITRGDVDECLKLIRTKELTDGGAVLSCLHSVYPLSPEPVLDACVQLYPQVHHWEVAQICKDSPQHFLYYVHKIQALPRHKQAELLEALYRDEAILHQWIDCALTEGAPDRDLLLTGQGEPRPGSHQLPWKHGADVDEILTHYSTDSESVPHSSAERQYIMNKCRKAGYWQGYLRLCKGYGHRQEALRAAVLLGDVQLLDPQNDPSVPPKSLEEWEEVFRLMLQLQGGQGSGENSHGAISSQDAMQEVGDTMQSENNTVPYDSSDVTPSPNDRTSLPNVESSETSDWLPQDSTKTDEACDWSPRITWEEAGRLLVSSVGPDKGIELLQRLPLPTGCLSEDFYKSCVLASMIYRRQRLLIHSMLEKVDTYLWSKRPTTLAPELYYAMQQEKLALQAQRKGTPVSLDRSLFVLDPNRLEGGVQYLEEPEGHWGITSEESSCAVCTLLLSDPISTSDPGVTVFPCGHAFHTHCTPQRGCLLCYVASRK